VRAATTATVQRISAQRVIALIGKPLDDVAVHCCLDLALLSAVALGRQLGRTPIVNSLPRNAALAHRLPDPGNYGAQRLAFQLGHTLLERARTGGNQDAWEAAARLGPTPTRSGR
jgi:hypothetical protein